MGRPDMVTGKLDTWAIGVHEIYESLRRAGFNKRQAVVLTSQAIHAQILANNTKADD